jgi:hypothetical protein
MAVEQGGVLSGLVPTKYSASDPITLFIIQVNFLIYIIISLFLILF